jgi:DNA-binding FadR family transcriptional regulator
VPRARSRPARAIGSFVAELSTRALFHLEPGQTEAAGLAAERATGGQRRAIRQALAAIDTAIDRGEAAVVEDFALHAAVTDATGNPQFRRFLDFLGRFIIPRASVRIRALNLRTYLMTFQQEHRAIVAGSVDQARAAMREHLTMSRERYRALAPDAAQSSEFAPTDGAGTRLRGRPSA